MISLTVKIGLLKKDLKTLNLCSNDRKDNTCDIVTEKVERAQSARCQHSMRWFYQLLNHIKHDYNHRLCHFISITSKRT